MCRFRSALLALTLLTIATPAGAGPADDRVERYLESRGLDAVLARQLLDRLDDVDARERVKIIDRLAQIYVRLIDSAESTGERAQWRSEAATLLRTAGDAASMDVRVRIRRAEYAAAERLAERWRMGLAEEPEKDEAIEILRAVAEDLARVGTEADRNALRLQRDEERTPVDERPLLAQLLSEAREARSLSFYLAGWSNAYLAHLQGAPARAEEAIRNLGWLLGSNPGQPASLSRAPAGLYRYDHVARSAIGVAWCHAMLGREDESAQWFGTILGAEEVSPAVLEAAPLWRIVCFAALHDWNSVSATASALSDNPAVPQLVAALAFAEVDADAGDTTLARSLRDDAIAAMVASGNLAPVVALGRRYGLSSLGDSGFAVRCVRGLTLFEEARNEDESSSRTLRQAADALAHALRADDVGAYPGAAGEVSAARAQALLLAARREQGREAGKLLLDASTEFERAASLLRQPARIADALYWSVRTCDEARDAGVTSAPERRSRLVSALLDGQSQDERAGLLLVQELADTERLDDAMIARLQRISPDSAAYDTARRLVARALYERRLEAAPENRDWAALRYVEAAEPVLADDVSAALAGDAEAAERALTRARRVLAAILDATAPDALRARRVLNMADQVIATGITLDAAVRLELRYRAAQAALAEGRLTDAESMVGELSAMGEDGARFADALRMSILRQAILSWQNARREGASSAALIDAASRAVAIGSDRLATLDATEQLAMQATLAQAAADLWREAGDAPARDRALAWLAEVHDAGVINSDATRLFAALAEESGDIPAAQGAWRDLSAALEAPDPAWFEARYQFMRLMAQSSPEAARALLAQHMVLYPDGGPAPWGEQVRALRDAVGAAEGGSSS